MALSADTLVHCGVPRDKAQRYLPLLTAGMREFEITTQQRGAFFLAQLLHESVAFQFFEEIASGADYEGRRDLGNVHRGDGVRYKGRGPIQLTGRSNYRFYGHKIGIDLEGHPRLAAKPRIGFRTAPMFFQQHRCNEMADRGDFIGVTKAINGGTRGLDDRQRYLRLLQGRYCKPGKAGIARGDKGDAVIVMTRRLSYVHSPKTDKPYLDGKRGTFDREAVIALKHFQKDHGLRPTGVFDAPTQTKLAHRVAMRKQRLRGMHPAQPPVVGPPVPDHPQQPPPPAAKKHRSTRELLAELERVDAVRVRLITRLLRRGARLERMLTGANGNGNGHNVGAHDPVDLHALAEELARLEAMIETVRATLNGAQHRDPAGQV
jgi:predicted chitinase